MIHGILFLLLVMLGSPTFALVGAISGGGGKSMVCRGAGGAITSAESLDLFEGHYLYQLSIGASLASMAQQIQNALKVIPPSSRGLIDFYVDSVQKHMSLTPVPLTDIVDPTAVAPLQGCKFEQLANYYNDNLILVNQEIWNSLDNTSKAALILHEAVYASNRAVGATDSRQSRHVVASLFDPSTHWTDVKDQVPSTALNCIASGGGLLMWAFPNASGDWVLQFQVLGNGFVMSKKTATFSNNDFNFNQAKDIPILPGEDNIGSGITGTGNTESAFEDQDVIAVRKIWEEVRDSDGNVVRGYQILHYYFAWTSVTYPKTATPLELLNCSLEFPGPTAHASAKKMEKRILTEVRKNI